jgi:hypothetical protein
MRIVSKNAAALFFPSTSLEFVYFEAIANAIDAKASNIKLHIEMDSFAEVDSLVVSISDDGEGFTEKNFEKFSKVLSVDDDQHKGIGRLVFLNYFDEVAIHSEYQGKVRDFVFNAQFDGESTTKTGNATNTNTTIIFRKYTKEKVKTYDYLVPDRVRQSVLEHFLPRLYQMKLEEKSLRIAFSLSPKTPNPDSGFIGATSILDISELPDLKEKTIPDDEQLFGEFKLLYSVERTFDVQSAITALCADGRTIKMEIISNKEFPVGYKMVFILYSDSFNGKTNATREAFSLEDSQLARIRKVFTRMVSTVIKEEIPEVTKENEKVKAKLDEQYPHLVGYFDSDSMGLVDKTNIVEAAQSKYFDDQKDILEASELSDEQFVKSLDFSSRILTEYILYRTKIIRKLKEMNAQNNEHEIHDLIVPRKRILDQAESYETKFLNNAWILDDKYMTYSKVLSDLEIESIYTELKVSGSHVYSEKETGRPDITIVFSRDPEQHKKVDVVVIEFKRLNRDLARKEEIFSQLKQRARRLLEFYPDKIQRIWFYGIIDFDKEFIASLIEDGYVMLFSEGEMFYKPQDIVLNPDTLEKKFADIFLLSYDAMLRDAESRNSTFLDILRNGIREAVQRDRSD